MKLTVWTYEGPPHVGAMRVATGLEDVHYVLHAPQGDTYADLLFTMIERRDHRPPVTYTTFQARDLGGDTADLVVKSVKDAYERFRMHLVESLEALLLARRAALAHPNPDVGVRVGLGAVLGVIDAGVEGPDGHPLPKQALVRECTDLLLAYLTGAQPGPSKENVDFFDVWG